MILVIGGGRIPGPPLFRSPSIGATESEIDFGLRYAALKADDSKAAAAGLSRYNMRVERRLRTIGRFCNGEYAVSPHANVISTSAHQ